MSNAMGLTIWAVVVFSPFVWFLVSDTLKRKRTK
jgi:hypothetical protein